MSESATHAGLVRSIVQFAEGEFGSLENVDVRDDAIRPMRGEKPPRIVGYIPDVYAINVPTTRTLIGEAKTPTDLESHRSQLQIAAFLEFLARTPSGIFVLAVPLNTGATARRVVAQLNAPFARVSTRIVVLDQTNLAWQ